MMAQKRSLTLARGSQVESQAAVSPWEESLVAGPQAESLGADPEAPMDHSLQRAGALANLAVAGLVAAWVALQGILAAVQEDWAQP